MVRGKHKYVVYGCKPDLQEQGRSKDGKVRIFVDNAKHDKLGHLEAISQREAENIARRKYPGYTSILAKQLTKGKGQA